MVPTEDLNKGCTQRAIDEAQPLEDEGEKKQSLQFAKWIFQVLYSPMKTFEEIVKNPNVKGPILILLITLPLTLSVQYTSGAKFFLEIPAPEYDLWTEKPSNLSLKWQRCWSAAIWSHHNGSLCAKKSTKIT